MLNAGDPAATQGLARDIYEVLDAQLRPQLEATLTDPKEQLVAIQEAWKKLSFCIASGVVEHVRRVPASKPDFAETFTSSAQDPDFWKWFSGFVGVLRNWAFSSSGDAAKLRSDLKSFFNGNPTPTGLEGIIR